MQWNRQDNSNYSQQPQQRTQGQNYNASQIQQGGIFQTGTQPQSFSGRQPSSQSTPFGTTGFAQTSSAYSPPPSQAFSQSTSSSAFGQQSSGSSFGQSNQPTVNPLQSVLSALQAAQATTSTQQRTQPNIGTQQSSQSVGSSVLNPSVLQQLQQLQAVLGQSQPQQQTPAPSQTQVSTQQTQGMPIQLLSQLQQLQQHLLSSGQQGQNQPNFQQASNIQNAQLLQQQLQQQQVQQLQQLQRLQSQQQQQQLSQAPQQKAPQSQQGFGNVGDQWRQQSSQQMGFGQQPRPSFGQQQNAQNYGQKQNYQQSGRSGMQDRRDSGRDANKGVGDRGGPRRDFNRRSPPRKPENKDRRSPPRRRSPVRESRTSAPVKREETRPKRRSKSPTKDKKETKDVKSTPEKKREKSPDEERKDKRRDVFHYSEYERDYYNIKRRYPKLYVSEDFARLISSWVNNCPLNSKFPIFEYNPIHVDNIKSDKIYSDPPFNSDSMSGEIVYNAKVMLTTGLPTELSSSKPISSQIKFLVAKHDRSALMCIGGPWSASIDGGDPANDDSALIRTAIRWTKEWTDIDLTYCEHWIHFMEIHYHRPQESSRPTHTEITVIFLPIFHNLIPGHDEFVQKYVEQQLAKHASEKSDKKEKHKEEEKTTESPTPITETPAVVVEPLSEEQKKKEEEDKVEKEKKLRERYRDDAPRHAGLLATFQKPECILISLDGLLEYNESDKLEKTFEVSLFAENFYEMLSRDFGSSIFETLLSQSYSKGKKRLRDNEGEERDSKKRTTEESTEKKDEEMKQETESPESKLIDLNSEAEVKLESTESTKPTEIVTESIPPLEAEGKSDMQTEEGIKLEETPQVKPEEAPSTPTNVVTSPSEQKPKEEKKRKTIVDNELLIAFQFFDRDNNGYLKESRVRQLIHSLGYYYSPYYVDTLVEKFAESKRIYYKKFTEKELHE